MYNFLLKMFNISEDSEEDENLNCNWNSTRLQTLHDTEYDETNFQYSYTYQDTDSQLSSNSSKLKSKSKKPLNVLVVDDSNDNRKIFMTLLKKNYKFNVDGAESAEKFFELIDNKEEDYDIVIMDNHMPIMTGVEAVSIARSNGYKGLIIGFTGLALSFDVQEFKDSGCDEVMLKPFQTRTFKNILYKYGYEMTNDH